MEDTEVRGECGALTLTRKWSTMPLPLRWSMNSIVVTFLADMKTWKQAKEATDPSRTATDA